MSLSESESENDTVGAEAEIKRMLRVKIEEKQKAANDRNSRCVSTRLPIQTTSSPHLGSA